MNPADAMPDPPPRRVFEECPDHYEALVDWPRRLRREEPFYRRWFQVVAAKRVLDAACGTGRHAAMFHSWGLAVEGADLSRAMIDYCRARYGEPAGLRWVERSFTEPADPPGSFDAVLCVGNSLALAGGRDAVRQAIRAMAASVRPGGLGIVQVLNGWRLPEGGIVWQKTVRVPERDGDRIFLKGVHRVADRAFVEFVELRRPPEGDLAARFDTSPIRILEADELVELARGAGAEDVRLFGDYEQSPYDRTGSADLIMVYRRTR